MTKQPARCGPFIPDPNVPPDPITGLGACLNCHLVGEPGDSHHEQVDVGDDMQKRAAGDEE